jgi:hypothetical protein
LSPSQKNSPHFMEPERSLPHSQLPATCPYPEPAQSIPYPHFQKTHLNIILPSAPGSPQWSLSLNFPHQNPVHAYVVNTAFRKLQVIGLVFTLVPFIIPSFMKYQSHGLTTLRLKIPRGSHLQYGFINLRKLTHLPLSYISSKTREERQFYKIVLYIFQKFKPWDAFTHIHTHSHTFTHIHTHIHTRSTHDFKVRNFLPFRDER